MIERLRKLLSTRTTRDPEVAELADEHERRVGAVQGTVKRAHDVRDRLLGEAFHTADGAAFRRPPARSGK